MIATRMRSLGASSLIAVATAFCLPATAGSFLPESSKRPDSPVAAAMAAPGATPCTGISYDENDPNTAYNYPVLTPGPTGVFLQRMTPTSLPFLPTAICVAGFGLGSAAAYNVVIYADANGAPGARLLTVPAVPAAAGSFPGTWMTTSLGASSPSFSGVFWAGFETPTTALYVDVDEVRGVNPLTAYFTSADGGATFIAWPGPAGVSIRVAGLAGDAAAVVPSLSGLGLSALVAALAAGGFLVLRRA